MRTKILFLLALLPFFQSNNSFASETEPDQTPRLIAIHSSGHTQPRSLLPYCYYYNGCVYIECGIDETSVSGTVTRSSDGYQWSNSANGNTLQIEVPTEPGTYTLNFTLSSGCSYVGEYVLIGSSL